MVCINMLKLDEISKINKFDFSEMTQPLSLRVSFFDASLDTVSSPINYSQEIQVPANQKDLQAAWPEHTLPTLYTANNTIDLAKSSRLLMLIWATGPVENFPDKEMLLG